MNRTINEQDAAYHKWQQHLKSTTLKMHYDIYELIKKQFEDDVVCSSLFSFKATLSRLKECSRRRDWDRKFANFRSKI